VPTGLPVLLVLWAIAAIGIGIVRMTPGQAVTILARCVGLELPWNFEGSQEAILYAVLYQGEEYLLRLMKIGKFILIQ